MYENKSSTDFGVLYQGDVITNFPFFILNDFKTLKDVGADKYELESINKIVNKEESLNVKSKLTSVILISQTCDIQRRENVLVCPLSNLSGMQLSADTLSKLKKRKYNYWFYLPEFTDTLPESLADFQLVYYVPRLFLEQYKSNKILSLSDWGRHHLGWALANYFGRPIEDK